VPPIIPIERKAAWILRLEQQRTLQDPSAAGANLALLAADPDAGVRRRAVLAIGRTGLPEGVPTVITALQDPEVAVRETAAFALGLLADSRGVAPLEAALADTSALVRGRSRDSGCLGTRPLPPPSPMPRQVSSAHRGDLHRH
jgi:HEAT repeat protein